MAYVLAPAVNRGSAIFLRGPLHRTAQGPPNMASFKAGIQENEVKAAKPFMTSPQKSPLLHDTNHTDSPDLMKKETT